MGDGPTAADLAEKAKTEPSSVLRVWLKDGRREVREIAKAELEYRDDRPH